MNQNSNVPTDKVAAAGVAGALSVLAIYVASLFNLDVPPEVASAFTTLLAFGAAYMKKESK